MTGWAQSGPSGRVPTGQVPQRSPRRSANTLARLLLLDKSVSELDDPLTERIIGCAIEAHRGTGAGLLESVYDVCFAFELEAAGFAFRRQCSVPIEYKSLSIPTAFRVDFVVEERVLVELKSVETLLPVHKAQVITYLKLTGLTTGLLINFNVPVLRQGVRRVVWTPKFDPAQAASPPQALE